MTEPITIEQLALAQASELAALHQQCFSDGMWSLEQLSDSLKLTSTLGFASMLQGKITGFILLQLMQDEAEILTFCVHPLYQRQKIGEQLLQYVISTIKESDLFLEVACDNAPACNLYGKLGFELMGRRPNYYRRSNGLVDALLFRRPRFASVG